MTTPADSEADARVAVAEPPPDHSKKALVPLMVGAIGVVYGDIGTSPLYTVREVFGGAHGMPLNEDRKSVV